MGGGGATEGAEGVAGGIGSGAGVVLSGMSGLEEVGNG